MGKDRKDKKRTQRDVKPNGLDKQTFSYYENVSKVFSGEIEFDSAESKASCINAILKTISEEGLKVSQDKSVSVIVEKTLALADQEQLRAIFENFSQDWEIACCDRSASFVTQSMLLYLNKFFDGDSSAGDAKSIEELVEELCHFLKSNVAFYMQHVSASHILRVVIETLAGCQMSEKVISGKSSERRESKKIDLKKPPKKYVDILHELCTVIINLPKLGDHVRNNLSNPVLQTILLSLKSFETEASSSLFHELMSNAQVFNATSDSELPENLTHEIGSRLAEQSLMTMPEAEFQKIWKKHFKGKLLELARHPIANYVLQKLILNARNSQQFDEMFAEMSPDLELIMEVNHFGVIVALVQSASKHQSIQTGLLKSLQQAFHCYDPPERQCKLVPLLMALSTYEAFYQLDQPDEESGDSGDDSDDSGDDSVDGSDAEKSKTSKKSKAGKKSDNKEKKAEVGRVTSVNYHGSLIIQNLLKFVNNRPTVNGLFELRPGEIKIVCLDPSGSYIIEAFLNNVKEKTREMLFNKLKGFYFDLACNRFGSRTFDALWKHATVNQKFTIGQELVKKESLLKSNGFGKFIYHKCSIGHLKHQPNHWKENLEKQEKMAKKRPIQEVVSQGAGSGNLKKKAKLKHN